MDQNGDNDDNGGFGVMTKLQQYRSTGRLDGQDGRQSPSNPKTPDVVPLTIEPLGKWYHVCCLISYHRKKQLITCLTWFWARNKIESSRKQTTHSPRIRELSKIEQKLRTRFQLFETMSVWMWVVFFVDSSEFFEYFKSRFVLVFF